MYFYLKTANGEIYILFLTRHMNVGTFEGAGGNAWYMSAILFPIGIPHWYRTQMLYVQVMVLRGHRSATGAHLSSCIRCLPRAIASRMLYSESDGAVGSAPLVGARLNSCIRCLPRAIASRVLYSESDGAVGLAPPVHI